VDYEQLPFKCKSCHEYGHFAKNCPKSKVDQPEEKEQEQWQQAKRKKIPNKAATHQQERREISMPSSPNKGKSLMVGDHEEESSKNRYTTLENLEAETIDSKEKEITEENQIHQEKDSTLPLDQQEPGSKSS
jgi:hypothetical protein